MMNNATPAKPLRRLFLTVGAALVLAGPNHGLIPRASAQTPASASAAQSLSPNRQAIAPVAAAVAVPDAFIRVRHKSMQ